MSAQPSASDRRSVSFSFFPRSNMTLRPPSPCHQREEYTLSLRRCRKRSMCPMVLIQLATGLGMLAEAILVKSAMEQEPMAGGDHSPAVPAATAPAVSAASVPAGQTAISVAGREPAPGGYHAQPAAAANTGRSIPIALSVRGSRRTP
ncbi:unnamed protein product [Victoria cruziana]